MKTKLQKFATIVVMPAAMLALTSCSSTPQGEGTTMVAAQKGVPGGVIVDTYKVTATVTAVDAASRKVTLAMADGAKTTVKAGPEVVNFDQIQVGDQVKATVAEQLVVFVRKNGEPASDGEAAAVALAPVGAKPGVLMANTVEVTAKVEALDLEHRKATLRFPDGTSKTFKVRKDVDMTKAKLGDEVVIRTTEAVAITVEKP
jgi:translation elongation factor P/translation initiation factor 5A